MVMLVDSSGIHKKVLRLVELVVFFGLEKSMDLGRRSLLRMQVDNMDHIRNNHMEEVEDMHNLHVEEDLEVHRA